ncbi:MAG: ComEC/Rec2 family competence protein, partial [Pseudomonadota bacterium]
IGVSSIDRLQPEETPSRVRLTWRGAAFDARPGDTVEIRAGLSPPPPPIAPGAFDFARHLYFQKIGAVGYAVSPPRVIDGAPPTWRMRLARSIEAMRLGLFRRIVAAAPGDGGAILAAVITGKRDAISDEAEAALRDAGLAHLLAISGLHMGLATGLIFFFARAALAASQRLALTFNIKKWAAVSALASGFFYLLLSGGGWSARRAFIMTAILFIAILADRRALSLRNVAIAATLILLATPEAVLQPGFQMSFAAATALIAFYEWMSSRAAQQDDFSPIARARRYVVGLAATDTIAALATAPFALYHFNRVALYSLPANVAAMPIMGFLIMPAAILALALTPFGLDAWAWRLAASGLDIILVVAGWAASQPGAVSLTPQWPAAALAVLSVGGLWLCLQQAQWRFAGLAAIPISAILISGAPKPDIFLARKGDNVGVIVADDKGAPTVAIFDRRRSRFDAERWREFAGLDPYAKARLRLSDVGACDDFGCVATLRAGLVLAVSSEPDDLAGDCARADLVIALYPAPRAAIQRCRARLIDRRDAWNDGAHAIDIAKNGDVVVTTVAQQRGDRPWTGAARPAARSQ